MKTKVEISYCAPRITTRTKLAPAGVRTIEPVSADQIEMNFVARVELLENGCWLWHGTIDQPHNKNAKRSPRFWRGTNRANGKVVGAHLYAYEKRVGAVPNPVKFVLRNECGQDVCVNPKHYRVESRAVMTGRESLPQARHAVTSRALCKNNLHDKIPENIVTNYRHGIPVTRCLPCARINRRLRYQRDALKK